MGVVYLAEQTEPIRRQVAVKLIKVGMDTHEVVARFRMERQALALMSHPYIATVIDAGSTVRGRPFFVMEYVPGDPITEFCDAQGLDTAARLDLFLRVCDGVQHAHQKGVIHRDLKPSNILVQRLENDLVPKIIDFGIAKSTGHQILQQAASTRAGMLIGTPEYLSPEQASLTEAGVDTRTDVYALGVLLYELLTGLLPFGRSSDPETPLDEILRRIRLGDPAKPSTRLLALGAEAETLAASRRTNPPALARRLRRDLDWIILRALEKNPSQRYGSVSALASDIRRHLHSHPVEARTGARGYAARLFVRRHRYGVTVFAASIVALAMVAFVLAVQARRIALERDTASREAATSKRVAEFLVGLFEDTNPHRARNREKSAVEIVDQGADRIRTELSGESRIRAEILLSIGTVYVNLGRAERAESLLKEAISLSGTGEGEISLLKARALESLALADKHQNRFSDAYQSQLEAIAIYRRTPGDHTLETGLALAQLAELYADSAQMQEALRTGREADRILTERFGERHTAVATARYVLGQVLRMEGSVPEATEMHRQSLEILLRELKRPSPEIATAFHEYANGLSMLGRHKEAEAQMREAVRDCEATLPPDHYNTAAAYQTLGQEMAFNGDVDGGIGMMIRSMEMEERLTGPNTFSFATGAIDLGSRLATTPRLEESAFWLRKGLASLQREFGNVGGHAGEAVALYVKVLRQLGRGTEADQVQRSRSVPDPDPAGPVLTGGSSQTQPASVN